METSHLRKSMPVSALFDPKIVVPAIGSAFVKLNPRTLMKNPVMFVLEIVTALTTIILIRDVATGGEHIGFEFQIILWLWFTVLFANFAEAVAEGRGKAQADTLRRQRTETQAKLITGSGDQQNYRLVPSTALKVGDLVLVEAGDLIPSDGEVVHGMASVNEAAITGEFAPVIRESGGDRSAVTGGTQVLSDWIRVRITAAPGSTFLDRMIRLVEGAERQKTPNEIALNILLIGLTIIFVFATATIPELRRLCRQHDLGGDPCCSIRHVDSDYYRCAPLRHWHCRHGSPCALQCACHVGPGGRGRGRRRYAPARQDRHDYARQPSGNGIQADPRRDGTGVGRCGTACIARRRDARRPLHRRPRQGKIWHPRPRTRRAGRQFHSVQRPDAHERRRSGDFVGAQGCRGRDPELSQHLGNFTRSRQHCASPAAECQRRNRARNQCDCRRDREIGRHPAGGGQGQSTAWRHSA